MRWWNFFRFVAFWIFAHVAPLVDLDCLPARKRTSPKKPFLSSGSRGRAYSPAISIIATMQVISVGLRYSRLASSVMVYLL